MPINYTGPSVKPHDVGVAVAMIIAKKGKLLLMKRTGSTGSGTWSVPGGAVEFSEDPKDAAVRELKEETALDADDFEFIGYTSDHHKKESLHYVTFILFTDSFTGTPRIMEPNKCTKIGWFSVDNLPKPLFAPTAKKIESESVKEKIKDS